MSIGEMQACLARLYIDNAFRELFFIDPPATLSDYGLEPGELAALTGIDRRALDLFASSLVAKRRKRVERTYPLLFKIDPAAMRRCYARFYQLYPARPGDPFLADILSFGAFAEETLGGFDHVPAYAGDVARYERLSVMASAAAAPDREDRVVEVDRDARPALRGGVEVGDFTFDVSTIEASLLAGAVPTGDECLPSPCTILFIRAPEDGALRLLRINTPTKIILDLCDGERSIGAIIDVAEQALGARDLHDGILGAIRHLRAAHALAFERAAPEASRLRARLPSGIASTEALVA